MTLNAIQASELLVKCGLSVGVIDCCSLKPMDMDCLRALFARGAKLITVEEGEMIGGFGSEIGTRLRGRKCGCADSDYRAGKPLHHAWLRAGIAGGVRADAASTGGSN